MRPEQMAQTSFLVQQARGYLEQQIGTVKNAELRQLIETIYRQPEPLTIRRMDAESRRDVWQALRAKGYTEASESDVFPPLPAARKDGEAFFSAPEAAIKAIMPIPAGWLLTSPPMSRLLTVSLMPTLVFITIRSSEISHWQHSFYTIFISPMFFNGRKTEPVGQNTLWPEQENTIFFPWPN